MQYTARPHALALLLSVEERLQENAFISPGPLTRNRRKSMGYSAVKQPPARASSPTNPAVEESPPSMPAVDERKYDVEALPLSPLSERLRIACNNALANASSTTACRHPHMLVAVAVLIVALVIT